MTSWRKVGSRAGIDSLSGQVDVWREALEETERRESEAERESAKSSSASRRKRRRRSTTRGPWRGRIQKLPEGLGWDLMGEEPDFRKQSKI
jgi:hypothetical protein